MNIEFIPLKENELGLLYQWFQVPHVKQWYARGVEFTLDMIRDKYLPRIDDPNIPNFIVYLNNQPIGYIQLYHVDKQNLPEGVNDFHHPLFSAFKPQEIAGIDLFIGEEGCLKKGIASQVLQEFITQFIKNKFSAAVVDPSINNEQAIRFFTRNGFEKLDIEDSDAYQLMLYKM